MLSRIREGSKVGWKKSCLIDYDVFGDSPISIRLLQKQTIPCRRKPFPTSYTKLALTCLPVTLLRYFSIS